MPTRSALDRQVLSGETRLQLAPRYNTRPAAVDDQVLQGSRRRIGVGDAFDEFVPPVNFPMGGGEGGTQVDWGGGSPASNVNWTSVINNADTSIASVIKTLFAPPTLIQTAQGTIYRAPGGGAAMPIGSSLFGPTATGSSLLPILLLGGAALLLISMAGKH
jgi:hypothetical protein